MEDLISLEAWQKVWTFREAFFIGFENTIVTSIVALLISLVLGIIFGILSTGESKILKVITRIYVEVIQNTPIILQMCFLYYTLVYTKNSIGIILTGIVALGIYHGAYMAEVVRAGIEAIPKGQFEAAKSQGFSYGKSMYYIILPQSIKIILPPMVNQAVNLVKNTSCLYIVGGADLISATYNFVTGANTGGAYAPAYVLCGVLFFAICFPLSYLATKWETVLKEREQRVLKVVNEEVESYGKS